MRTFISQLKYVINDIFEHFSESPISATFFIFIFCVFFLNIIRKIIICQERKNRSQNHRCKYLINLGNEQDCDIPSRRKQFREKGNSCASCRRRALEMTDVEVENRIAMGYVWKYRIVLLANYSKYVLPYISFLYTLAMTVFGKNN